MMIKNINEDTHTKHRFYEDEIRRMKDEKRRNSEKQNRNIEELRNAL